MRVSDHLAGLAGVLDRYDQADTCYAQAAQFKRRAGAKILGGQHRTGLGKMLAERDKR